MPWAWIVVAVVVGSVSYLVWSASRRRWNAGGEDDARRAALSSSDQEDGSAGAPERAAGPSRERP